MTTEEYEHALWQDKEAVVPVAVATTAEAQRIADAASTVILRVYNNALRLCGVEVGPTDSENNSRYIDVHLFSSAFARVVDRARDNWLVSLRNAVTAADENRRAVPQRVLDTFAAFHADAGTAEGRALADLRLALGKFDEAEFSRLYAYWKDHFSRAAEAERVLKKIEAVKAVEE